MTTASCASGNKSLDDPALPTLGQMRSRVAPLRPGGAPPSEQPMALAQITPIYLPADHLTHTVWKTVGEAALDPTVTQAWRDNGIRVGVLEETRLNAFIEALPVSATTPTRWVTIPASDTPIPVSPVVNQPIRFFLSGPDGRRETVRLNSGRLQLLARAMPNGQTGGVLELTPHVYESRTTLQPRTPQEKALDGRILDWLTLRVPLRLDGLLIIGLYTPETDADDENNAVDATDPEQPIDTATDQEPLVNDEKLTKPPRQPMPNHLGKFMLSASRFGKPVQAILLIRLARVDDFTIYEVPAPQDQPGGEP